MFLNAGNISVFAEFYAIADILVSHSQLIILLLKCMEFKEEFVSFLTTDRLSQTTDIKQVQQTNLSNIGLSV